MKNQHTQIKSLTLLLILLLQIGCSRPPKEEVAENQTSMTMEDEPLETPTEPNYKVDASFQQQIGILLTGYADLQEAFFSSDVEKVKKAGLSFNEILKNAKIEPEDGAAKLDWNVYRDGMSEELQKINAAGDIKEARTYLPGVTDGMYKSIKSFGLGGDTAYYARCPMALNNKGGYWLTKEKIKRNPYFGDAMPDCGSIIEQLK